MCGRFTLRTNPNELCSFFGVHLPDEEIHPRFNIAPTQKISIIAEREDRAWSFFRWGLVPFWAKSEAIGNRLINARGETIAEKPAFRAAFKKRRCIVMADGFYEWEKTRDHGKVPHHFTRKDGSVMAFAGLWEKWGKEDKTLFSCTIITTSANALLHPFHDRMPVILEEDEFDLWLDPTFSDRSSLEKCLDPYPTEEMSERRVSTRVNSVKNETADCLEDFEEPPGLF